jgi:hypothetical protein
MEKLKIGYETLREINPRVIHSSTSGMSVLWCMIEITVSVTDLPQDTDQQVLSLIEPATT